MDSIFSIFGAIIAFGLLIFIHELGHFLLAKWCGVGVVKFAVGFGPALLRFRYRETDYQLGIIPLGGFVRMVGDIPDPITGEQATDAEVQNELLAREEDAAKLVEGNPELAAIINDRSRWFIDKNYWQRSAIVAAGPIFNLLFAIFLAGAGVYFYGMQEPTNEPQIGSVAGESPAFKANLQKGDVVTAIDGKPIPTWEVLAETIRGGDGSEIRLDVKRGEEAIVIAITPVEKPVPISVTETKPAYLVGIGPSFRRLPSSFLSSLSFGAEWTYDKVALTFYSLGAMISQKVSSSELAGPVFIFKAMKQQADEGIEKLLYFSAFLSVSLAILNLLPIPVLDGGHLFFFTVEALFGRIPMRAKLIAQQFGFLFLISLMLFAVYNDLTRKSTNTSGKVDFSESEEEK